MINGRAWETEGRAQEKPTGDGACFWKVKRRKREKMAKIAKLQEVATSSLKPYDKNARVHTEDQVNKIAESIKQFGFLTPCIIDRENNIIAGHGRKMAAEKLGLQTVPCVYIDDLTEEQRRAYILADNRLTELGGWDDEILEQELREIYSSGFEIGLTGFEFNIDDDQEAKPEDVEINPVTALPESRIFVYAISAFGTNSEKFIEIQLSPEEAEHFIKRVDELQASAVVEKLRGGLNEL